MAAVNAAGGNASIASQLQTAYAQAAAAAAATTTNGATATAAATAGNAAAYLPQQLAPGECGQGRAEGAGSAVG